MKRIVWILAPGMLFLVVVARTAELQAIARTLVRAAPAWLLLALFLQVAFTVTQGATYQAIFRLLELDVPLRAAVYLALAMAFGSLASPIGTSSGIVYFVFTARLLGLPGPPALWTSLTFYLFDYTAVLAVVAVGALGLGIHHDLHRSYLVTAGLFGAAAAVALGLVGWSLRRPEDASRALAAVLAFVHRTIGRRLRRPLLDGTQVGRWSDEVREALLAARRHRRHAAVPLLLALTGQGLGVATLAASFWAVGHPVAPDILVAGYAVGALFMIVSVTPSGVGIVEGALTLTFVSLGVPVAAAVAATLLFRLFTIWLPMLAGFGTVRRLRVGAVQTGVQ